MNHNTIFPCSFLKPLRCRFSFLWLPVPLYLLSLVLKKQLLENAGIHPILMGLCPSRGQRHLPAMGTFAAGDRTICSPWKCALRWVSEPAWSCQVDFWWLDRRLPLNMHQGSTELPSTCFGVRGSVHLTVSEDTHSTSPVTEGERGGHLAKASTIQGLSHLFLCCAITLFCTANDASESAHSLLHPISTSQRMRQVTLTGGYTTSKSKAVSEDRWINRTL